MRRAAHELRPLFRLARDRQHCVAERVELFLRLGLGRLDHQRARDDQREVNRRRMEAVIHQPLRDVERVHIVRQLILVAEHDLVQRRRVVRQVIRAFQPRANVVRVQHRELRDSAHAVRSHRAHVRQRANEHAEVAVERAHAADRIGMRIVEIERAVFATLDRRRRQKRHERLRNADRTRARTAAAVRRRKGLVQVRVNDVDAHVARPRHADE